MDKSKGIVLICCVVFLAALTPTSVLSQTEERGKVQAEKEYIYSKDKLEDDSSPDETLEVDFQWAKKKLAADRKKRRVREESLLQEINREAAADLPPLFDTEREIFTLSAARKEIRRLNRQMEKIRATIISINKTSLQHLESLYKSIRDVMNKHRLVKSEFETMKQFNTRSAGCRMKMKTLEFGYRSALADINYRFNTHYKSQLERYRQRADEFKALKYITTGLKLKLLRYNAERSYYYINIYDTTGKCRKFKLTIKPEKAKAIHDRQHQLRVVCNYLKPGGWDELKVSAILDPVFKRLTQLKNIDVRSKSIQCYNDPAELVQIAENDILVKEMGAARVIIDYGTGLAWYGVKTTSEQTKHWERFLGKLNREKYGGFTKWRLPTLAEIGSLYSLNTGGRKLFPDYQDIKAADKLNSSNFWIVTLWKKYMVADRYTYGYLILPVCSMD